MPIIPTRRGLRILSFTKLDGAAFVSVVRKAAKTALGKGRIIPLKRVEGNLVSNSWEEHPDGRAYLTKLGEQAGTDARRATTAAAGRTAGSAKGRGASRRRHLVSSGGPSHLSRVVDIYATEVRPLEGRYYGWLRGLRDLACRGEWEKIPKEPQAFIRKLLRKLPRTAEQESAPAETPPRKGKARTRRAEAAVHPRLLSGASRLPKRFPRLCRSGTSGGYGST